MVKELEPSTPQEYVVKAVSYASLGPEIQNAEMLKQAQHYFQLVGSSASECDTIPGRQCMESCFFLLKQFDDALIYLKVRKPPPCPSVCGLKMSGCKML
jgi:intraflagellar transport protein 56